MKWMALIIFMAPVTASCATFVQDSLSGTDGQVISTPTYTPTLGTWTKHASSSYTAGSFIFDTGRARSVDANAVVYYMTPMASSADYYVETVLYQQGTTITGMGPAGRIDVGSNTMYFARGSSSASQWQLLRISSGTAATLGTAALSTSNGQSYTLRLEMIGTAIKVYLGGSEIISVTDSAISSAGRAGVRGTTNGTNGHYLDSFIASTIDSESEESFSDGGVSVSRSGIAAWDDR